MMESPWINLNDQCGVSEDSMGFFDFLKPRNKEYVESCWPGGKMLQIHMDYDTQNQVFTYVGRYGLQFSIAKADLTEIIVKAVSRTHSVIQFYKGDECVGTTDITPTEACETIKGWMQQF